MESQVRPCPWLSWCESESILEQLPPLKKSSGLEGNVASWSSLQMTLKIAVSQLPAMAYLALLTHSWVGTSSLTLPALGFRLTVKVSILSLYCFVLSFL